jgi:SAM-dependent methyltransferase
MFKKLKERKKLEAFHPTWLGMVISPVYIIRRGLHKAILNLSSEIKGCVLDFGCGTKPYECLFKNATSYTGVDIEVSGHSHSDSKVDFFYDGKTLPFADSTFDSVVSFEVLEHVFNIQDVLSEIERVLKRGGVFLVTIPFAWEEHEVPYDFARYTSYGIEHLLRQAGFDKVRIVKSTSSVLAICQMFIAYMSKYLSPRGRSLAIVFQLFIIFPLNIISLLMDAVFSKQYGYFCNCVIVCEKK